ncbi:hypothetical protein BST61_g9852 [Cercospora zeina]
MAQNESGVARPCDEMPPTGVPSAQPASSANIPSDFPQLQLGPKRKRGSSPPLFVNEENDLASSPPPQHHGSHNKRSKLSTHRRVSGSCHPRCGHPLDSPIHQHFPWCHPDVPVVEATVLEICKQLAARVQEYEGVASDSIMAKSRAINASKDLRLLYPLPKLLL